MEPGQTVAVTLVGLALLAALVVAVICRGRPSTYSRPSLRRSGLLGIALVGMVTSLLAKFTGVAVGWLVVSAVALVCFGVLNRGRPGIGLAVIGLGLNALVMIVNGAMPVSIAAIERAGVPPSRVPVDSEAWAESRPISDPLRTELTDQTKLPWLGEAVPLALPLRPSVASVGDVLVAAGAALFVFTGLTGFGRSVPERELTPQERKERRRARRARKAQWVAAKQSAAVGAPALAGPPPELVNQVDQVDQLQVAPQTVPSSAGPVEVETPAGTITEPTDPAAVAAAEAAAERQRIRRANKRRRRAERRRLAAVALASTQAAQPEGEAQSEQSEPPEASEAALVPVEGDPAVGTPDQPDRGAIATPPAHASIGAARGRQAARAKRPAAPPALNGSEDDAVAVVTGATGSTEPRSD